MDISDYLRQVREGIENATSLADSDTKDVASRVASSVEPVMRLALIDAISDATAEINDELSTADVSMTLQRGNPAFAVAERGITAEQFASYAKADSEDVVLEPLAEDDEAEEGVEDDELVRFSLRIPKWVKDKVDQRAARGGISTNAYLSELIVAEVARRRERRDFAGGPGRPSGPGFGGPFGPGGGFGPGRGFGPGFVSPEMIGELGRVFAETFGESGERRRGGPGGRHGRRCDGAGRESDPRGDDSPPHDGDPR